MKINYNMIGGISLIFAISFLLIGIIEALSGLLNILCITIINNTLFTADIFGGITLATIGSIYLIGFLKSVEKDVGSVSYVYVGSLIGIAIGILYILLMGANIMEYLLGNMEGGWNILDDITVYLILGLSSTISYLAIRNIPKYYKNENNNKDEF
ncbi:hypothetical protein [Methanococcus aeolicus]|uniref:hypothetical protein n=1 Tax=Methanococcus aeolicus TaxID=42879 RepID=UPI0021C9EDED|nr:hypothetical protein [Methanococcus aeolicus]UXM85048.1 hypothetical protein N6C89_01835 [Methanococcus aeolicus]